MAKRTRLKKRIIHSAPGQEVISRSKNIYLPGFNGLSLYEAWPLFIRQLHRTRLVERASGISFNVVMALPPTLLFLFTLIPLLPISQQFVSEIFTLVRDIVPGEKNNAAIIEFLNDFLNRPRTGLLSFGLMLAIFFSSNAMMGILRAFEQKYPGFGHRKGIEKRKVAFKLTLIVLILVLFFLLLLIAQGQVLQWVGIQSEVLRSLIHNLRWVVILLLLFFIVAFIYRHGPPISRKWPLLTPGSFFATLMMVLATLLVTFWVNNFPNYNKLYGSISAIIILMSLIYVNALAILLGFELNVAIINLNLKKRPPAPPEAV